MLEDKVNIDELDNYGTWQMQVFGNVLPVYETLAPEIPDENGEELPQPIYYE